MMGVIMAPTGNTKWWSLWFLPATLGGGVCHPHVVMVVITGCPLVVVIVMVISGSHT